MPQIKLLVEGGNMKPGPAVAQQLGPMGINMGKVISDVNSATADFKGMEVPVVLDVDAKTKEFSIDVKSPSVSALIKKELKLEKASGARLKEQSGNIAIEQVISVTKQKYPNMLANDFLGALKSVIGSCMTLGLLIESKDPKLVLEDIAEGKYNAEIESQKTEASPEKLKELNDFFKGISAKQQADKAAEEAEAKEAEEKKEETK
jgi:large subunit ribosomal protein L11